LPLKYIAVEAAHIREIAFVSVIYSFEVDGSIQMKFSQNYMDLNFLAFPLFIPHEEASNFL
jgi:hypothetical protein